MPEAKNEGETGNDAKDGGAEGPVVPETKCVSCTLVLSEDEITINQRFVDQALIAATTTD